MKKILLLVLCTLVLIGNSYSKIISIENINLEVPESHISIKYTNEEIENLYQDFTDTANITTYLVGPKKYVDLEKAILDGEDIMDNPYAKLIMKKMEKKNFRDEVQASKWIMSEIKKIMKKEKIDFISYVITSDQNLITTLSDDDFSEIIDELNKMNQSELNEQTKEIRKMITSLSGNNKSIPINDSMTINLSKFKISKNKSNQLFLKAAGNFIYIMGPMSLDIDLNLFLTEYNDKAVMLVSACYVNCSKFNNKFNKMRKNSFNSISINTSNNINKSDSNLNIVEQIKQLDDLYKSGALTKEEFEKAKKKILN